MLLKQLKLIDEFNFFEEKNNQTIIFDNYCIVKVLYSGICGSDIHRISNRLAQRKHSNLILGHEVVGIVSEITKNTHGLSVGDTVVVNPLFGCQKCVYCTSGLEHHCKNVLGLGKNYPGSFSDKIIVPLHKVEKTLSNIGDDKVWIFVDSVAVCLNAIHSAGISENKDVLILGDGPIGILLALLLKEKNNVLLLGKKYYNLTVARNMEIPAMHYKELQLRNHRNSYHYVFEAKGGLQSETIRIGIDLASIGGIMCVLGVFDENFFYNINMYDLFKKEIILRGANSFNNKKARSDFKQALNWISTHEEKLQKLITRTVVTWNWKTWSDMIRRRQDYIKIILSS